MTGSPQAGSLLLIESYYGGSHRAWAEGLVRHLERPVELVSLPARWWKWRMRGGAVTLAERLDRLPRPPAVVLVSDMIDLPAFLTFARPHIGDAPVALYFHESQLTYPDSPQMEPDLHFAVTNWLSALAADRVFFNSAYHRDVFFAEVPKLLRHFPDHTHEHLVEGVREKSRVLEVGIELDWLPAEVPARQGPVRILWNHRWEHDKDPEAFFGAVDRLVTDGLEFEVVVCGESFRQQPTEFQAAAGRHRDRIVHMGYVPLDAYRRHLLEADVVVSTALQEFFGIAVIEAIAAGCFPVVPDRLAYPSLLPPAWHRQSLYPEGGLVERLRWAVTHPDEIRSGAGDRRRHMARFGWATMAPRYSEALASLVEEE